MTRALEINFKKYQKFKIKGRPTAPIVTNSIQANSCR
jgi:hypothetical protein